MNRVSAITLFLVALFPLASFSEPASDARMADEAIAPYAHGDPDKLDRVIQEHAERLRDLATDAPDEVWPASVFFSRGLSYREMHELREDFGFEVIDLKMKAPQGDQGVVMSIGGGMADLFAIEGTFEERLEFVVKSQQRCFARRARLIPDDDSQALADLATKPFLVYSARIFGPNKVLRELQQQPVVRGVFLIQQRSIISDFEAVKANPRPHPYTMPGFYCD